jgi:hypothetical protein
MKEKLSKFIRTSPGFQYSVNIKFDLTSEVKVANYVPLIQNLKIINDILDANNPHNTKRSTLVVGSYGTGKSHLITVTLSLLARVLPSSSYDELMNKIESISPSLFHKIRLEFGTKHMLPIILSGDERNLDEIMLTGLVTALKEVGIDPASVTPNTSFSAALDQINTWEAGFPKAYQELNSYLASVGVEIELLKKGLAGFNKRSYNTFNKCYKHVTHGASFQPLLVGSVQDVYRAVAKRLPSLGYKGMVIVFDEFGKYLETYWNNENYLDLKPLQDLAETCNSSEDYPIQLVLIAHKPIAQYGIKYGQDMVNEWRKVEGRFNTYDLVNLPSDIYQIISRVIIKEETMWTKFIDQHQHIFDSITGKIVKTRLFSDISPEEYNRYIKEGAYPLHPVSAFCLPRFSQKVAQNERTVFTFLAGNESNSLCAFLDSHFSDEIDFLTLDILFDYFEPQMRDLEPQDNIHQIWLQTIQAIARIDEDYISEIRVLKALGIVKAIGLPAVLPPNQETLQLAFLGSEVNEAALGEAIQGLLNKKVLYEGATTGNLEIIEVSELDIEKEIDSLMVKRKGQVEFWSFLNNNFTVSPVLAKRYNDEFTMTRYFRSLYMSVESSANTSLTLLDEQYDQDGVILYLMPRNEEEIKLLFNFFAQLKENKNAGRVIFIATEKHCPFAYTELEPLLRRYDALQMLLQQIEDARHRQGDRLEILLWLSETKGKIDKILNDLFDFSKVEVYVEGDKKEIRSRSDLSRLVSEICLKYFNKCPKFNNELINKHMLTTPIVKARQKIVDGLLKPHIKQRLGIIGTGPEMAIYRSILIQKQILIDDGENLRINELKELKDLTVDLRDEGLVECLSGLNSFLSRDSDGRTSFLDLMKFLCSPPYGLRKGIIPILLALVLHQQRNEIICIDQTGVEIQFSAHDIDNACKNPENFVIVKQNWSEEKAAFCSMLPELFSDYLTLDGDLVGPAKIVVDGFKRWFLSLPRFTRDSQGLTKEAKELRKVLKKVGVTSNTILFDLVPKIFGISLSEELLLLVNKISRVKAEMDGYLLAMILDIEKSLIAQVPNANGEALLGVLKTWYAYLNPRERERLYSDGTQEIIDMIETFEGENSLVFLKKLLTVMTGLRPEDWNDSTIKNIVPIFRDMMIEVTAMRVSLMSGSTTKEIALTFLDGETQMTKSFPSIPITETGEILENLITAHINEYGDSITNNEKRQILLNVLLRLIR